jgi:signal transduction histidine kinase
LLRTATNKRAGALSLRGRLTVWYILVLVLVLTAFGVDVLLTQRRVGLQRLDRDLHATHTQLTGMLHEELREDDAPQEAAEDSLRVIGSGGYAVAVAAADGRLLASTVDPRILQTLPASPGSADDWATLNVGAIAWRVHSSWETVDGHMLHLIVASPMSDLERDQRNAREAILLGIPTALLLAGAGGLWLASVALRPITSMATRAEGLAATGIDDLGPPLRDDELGRLTRAFNGLVARLRAALKTQQQFMADASHELRSPVSVIRAAADVTLSREHREEPEYREALTMTAAQSRHLASLVDDMLMLARADAGGYPLRIVDLRLRDVIDECCRAIGVVAAERQIALRSSVDADVSVLGDEALLRRLIVNLLQNAVQHTPSGGIVSVAVQVDGGDVRIRVTDSGAGIADADRARIFERFVQLDPSRRSSGAGLGLTIARWIAEAHRGGLMVESTGPEGSTFCLWLPLSPESA